MISAVSSQLVFGDNDLLQSIKLQMNCVARMQPVNSVAIHQGQCYNNSTIEKWHERLSSTAHNRSHESHFLWKPSLGYLEGGYTYGRMQEMLLLCYEVMLCGVRMNTRALFGFKSSLEEDDHL